VIALAQVEAAGQRIDLVNLKRAMAEAEGKIERLKEKLTAHEVWRVWRRRFGLEANLDSRPQLGKVLYEEMKYKSSSKTEGGDRESTDESALLALADEQPFVVGYMKLQKIQKAYGTYLKGIAREVTAEGFIHPVFNLHTVQTYRSSSDSQQYPVRNQEMGELVRRNFIARDGHVLVENDFKGIEVTLSAAYHHDPVFIKYISDPKMDMHRDLAMQLYNLDRDEWKQLSKGSKSVRHAAKNKFVFPQFYGDWFVNCATNLWEEIDSSNLRGPDGASLRDHLYSKGMAELGRYDGENKETTPGSFMAHVQEVEHDFWYNRFKVYGQWRKDWFESYLKTGQFRSLTGFLYQGVMRRNEVTNYAIQGSAFHCLLWSLIRIQRELRRNKMRTKIVGQIHDSILADVYIPELDQYLEIVRRVTERDILKDYDWLIVPLSIECEISPIGKSWHDKRSVDIRRDTNTYSVEGFNGSAIDLLKFWQGS